MQGPNIDIGQSFERGMRLGEMVRQRKAQELEQQKQNDIKEAYNSGYETRPDGSSFFNPQRVSEHLKSKGLGLEAQKFDQDYQTQQAAQLKSQLENQYNQSSMVSSLLGTVRDQASYDAAKAQAMKFGIQGVDQLPSQYNPQFIDGLKAQYGKASMSYEQQMKDERDRENMALKRQDQSLDRQLKYAQMQGAREERQNAIQTKLEEKQMSLMTPYGLANTAEDAKNIKAADEEKKNFDAKINELIKLRTDNNGGALLDREAVSRAKQLSKDLLLTYKNMAKLGVLSQSDEAIINAIIPEDPLQYSSPLAAIQGQDPILSNLKKFKKDSDLDFGNKVQNRIRGGGNYQPEQKQQQTQKPPWAK